MNAAELRCIRITLGLTQDWAAARIFGVSRRTVQQWELGKNSNGNAVDLPEHVEPALEKFLAEVGEEISKTVRVARQVYQSSSGSRVVLRIARVQPLDIFPLELRDIIALRAKAILEADGLDVAIEYL